MINEGITHNEFNFSITENGTYLFFIRGEERNIPDFVIPRTGSGTDSKAATLYRQLQIMGVPVINHASGMETATDKFHTLQLLAANRLPIPKTMYISRKIYLDRIEDEFSFPLIVKIWPGSHGQGVHLTSDKYGVEDVILIPYIF